MRVPDYGQPQVAPQNLPNVQLTAPAGLEQALTAGPRQLEQFGGAMQGFGKEMAQIAITEQIRQNEADAKAADVAAMGGIDALLNDPEKGFSLTRGKGAMDAYPDTVEAIKQAGRETLNGIANPRARELATPVINARVTSAINSASRHAGTQRMHYLAQTSDTRAMATLQDAANNFADNDAFWRAVATAKDEAKDQAEIHGWDESTTRLQAQKYVDAGFKMRYEAWRLSDPVSALSSFWKSSALMSPLERVKLGHQIFDAAAPELAAQLNASGGPATPGGDPSQPRGVRNNNPGNVMRTDTPWQGEVPGSDPRYSSFESPEAGIRAMGRTLLSYQDKYNIDSVRGIVSRWAPATENDTNAYIAAVAKAVGVKPDEKIDVRDPGTLTALTKAIITHENGKQPYTDAQFAAGLNAAAGNGELPKVQKVPLTRDPTVTTGDPLIDSLPSDWKAHVLNLARSQASQTMTAAREQLRGRVQDAQAAYLTNGTAPNPPGEGEFISAYGQREGAARYRDFQDVAKLGGQLQQVKGMSNADLVRVLEESKPADGDGFAVRQHNYEILQKAVETTIEQRQKDPILYAMQRDPALGFKPLANFADGQAVSGELRKRAAAMDRIARDYGTRPFVMTKQEADAFGEFVDSLQSKDKARVLGSVASVTGAAGVQSLSLQIKDKKNTLAVAAMLAGYNEPDKTSLFGNFTPGRNAAELYLQGLDAINEKRAKIDATAETGIKAEIYKTIEGVYQTPQGRDAAAEAAYGIYGKLRADGKDSVKTAVDLATGGVMELNGSRIAKPYGWEDGRFLDTLRGAVAERVKAANMPVMIGGQKVGAADFAKALPGSRLQTWGQGTYLVMAGNDVARNIDGTPYVLKVAP